MVPDAVAVRLTSPAESAPRVSITVSPLVAMLWALMARPAPSRSKWPVTVSRELVAVTVNFTPGATMRRIARIVRTSTDVEEPSTSTVPASVSSTLTSS